MGILRRIVHAFYPLRMKLSKLTGLGITVNENKKMKTPPVSFYSLSATSNSGTEISFEQFRGKKVLIVNLASQCGFTPQYEELEKLHEEQGDQLTVLGFPSNDFGEQEPGSDDDIAQFCKINFDVTFPLFHKDHVKDDNIQPVYQWLTDPLKNGWNSDQPRWNFYKYLVNEQGELIKLFSSSVSPKEVIK